MGIGGGKEEKKKENTLKKLDKNRSMIVKEEDEEEAKEWRRRFNSTQANTCSRIWRIYSALLVCVCAGDHLISFSYNEDLNSALQYEAQFYRLRGKYEFRQLLETC